MPQQPPPRAPRPALTPLPLSLPQSGSLPDYAELHCRSNFSFLTGASHPEELVERAQQLGYCAIALTDECSVAGVVRAHAQAKQQCDESGKPLIHFIVGSQFELHGHAATPGCRLVLLARSREGYAALCGFITLGRLRSEKGSYRLDTSDFDAPVPEENHLRGAPDCWAMLIPRREDDPATLLAQARWMKRCFGERAAIAVELLLWADDETHTHTLVEVSEASGVPLVAAGDVLMHARSRKALQDTLTAIRVQRPLTECGRALARNAEQHLRSRLRLSRLYRRAWLDASVRMARECRFSLDELRYEYPEEIVPPGLTPTQYLRQQAQAGACSRYPQGVPPEVRAQIERELALIAELRYEAFFLTVYDVVRFARSRGILCQGRGSAANSAVCYCLGITEVDPTKTTLLFERFISRERNEPPDIDVDFEHERREDVIQYIYGKYGVQRTALAAALVTYRTRGAVRDVGKALGFEPSRIDRLAKSYQWFDDAQQMARGFLDNGFDPEAPLTKLWLELVSTLRGFPRHLTQHSGGFVIARDRLSRLVPIENAAMQDRRVIQWDKDDLESLGLLKVDVLALGMLSALRRSLDLINAWRGLDWTLHDIPRDDDATYEMAARADTVGVFQIESRAQQSMLPRLKPREFYDLVVQVAIVRPGPIQGGMVHPYLRRRQGLEPCASPKPELDPALKRTLGVPIFQEQVMQICMIAAGFTGGEADTLRRAMAAWKRKGGLHRFRERIIEGMTRNGYEAEFAENLFKQIQGFGDYGFPESHAYSFAILAYFSAWIKCHEPAIFVTALLNSQPMGFYGPSQLVQDAKRHGVQVRRIDVMHSDWDCTLEPRELDDAPPREFDEQPQPAMRLGLRLVRGLAQEAGERIAQARQLGGSFIDVEDLARRASLDAQQLQQLASADALLSLSGHRRQQLWAAAGHQRSGPLLSDAPSREAPLALPRAAEGEEIVQDYDATGLTLRRHPVALLRAQLQRRRMRSAKELAQLRDGQITWACGIVTMRQQPETAKGTIFVTLEDETGSVNVIVWRRLREKQRQALLGARLLAVAGVWQSQSGVMHLVARHLLDVSDWLGRLHTASRDFH